MEELLQMLHSIVEDFKCGAVDEIAFKERIIRLAERYERSFVRKEPAGGQKGLF